MAEADEANTILARAHAREALRAKAQVPVDYKALNVMVKRQRAALTRAIHSGDKAKVVLACRNAVSEWDKPGAMWPDDWASWQRALDDVLGWGQSVDLRDLR